MMFAANVAGHCLLPLPSMQGLADGIHWLKPPATLRQPQALQGAAGGALGPSQRFLICDVPVEHW